MRKIIGYPVVLILLICAALWGPASAEQTGHTPEHDVTVLFTSDVHCGVDQNFTYAGLKAMKDTLASRGALCCWWTMETPFREGLSASSPGARQILN